MGGSSYSSDFYNARVADRAAKGTPTFAYSHDVASKPVSDQKVHDALNPMGVIRESRDSTEHPNSTAIGVIFDVTGSMQDVPVILQKKLNQLMGLIERKGYITDPQILFGSIGDYTCRSIAPLQVGQFESGNEMDDDLTRFWLEGKGGGTNQESYLNALYFMAARTSCDCFEKRGKKGYLFIIGDEQSYDELTKSEVSVIIGDKAQTTDGKIKVEAPGKDIPVKEVVRLALEKWEIFFFIPNHTQNYKAPWLKKWWSDLLGEERVIEIDDSEAVCETIGLTIGLMEGTVDADGMRKDLKDIGTHAKVVDATTSALDGLAKSTALAKAGTASSDLAATSGKSSAVDRL